MRMLAASTAGSQDETRRVPRSTPGIFHVDLLKVDMELLLKGPFRHWTARSRGKVACLKTLQVAGSIAAGVEKRLFRALEPAQFVYLYEQTTWKWPAILLKVWPFDTARKAACMKREQFLAQPEVESFVAWLAANLPALTFKLRFKSSNFVPGGLTVEVQGIERILELYRWKASWHDSNQNVVESETWAETQRSLGQLREWLTSAVNAGDDRQALQACLQILRWGGVRGAIPFLQRLAAKGELSGYLKKMAGLMKLDGDNDLDDLDARQLAHVLEEHLVPFLRREHLCFQRVLPDGHDQPLIQPRRPLDDVDVPVGDGVEHSRKDGKAGDVVGHFGLRWRFGAF